jgi:hypothetical protein
VPRALQQCRPLFPIQRLAATNTNRRVRVTRLCSFPDRAGESTNTASEERVYAVSPTRPVDSLRAGDGVGHRA